MMLQLTAMLGWSGHLSRLTHSDARLLAQTAIAPTSHESALAFLYGPQFFIALIAGVVMAFAFQFLLTNFSVAVGLSGGTNPLETDVDGWGKKIRTIELRVGGWTVFIVNVALFIACFLAVKLTLINNAWLAAIVSIVIWSVYFLLLLWSGSQAVGSLVGSVTNAAGAGAQGITSTVATALSGTAVNSQVVNTVEASIEAVTQQLRSAIAPDQMRETVEDYLSNVQVPQLNLAGVGNQFVKLLQNADLESIAEGDLLNTVNRETLLNLVSSRTDLSQQEIEQITDQLEAAWKQVVGSRSQQNGQGAPNQVQTALVETLASAMPENGQSVEQLRDRLQQLLQPQQNQKSQGSSTRDQVLQMGINTLVSTVLQQTNPADPNTQNITEQLNTLVQQAKEQAGKVSHAVSDGARSSVQGLQTDVEHYLLDSPSWYLKPDSLDQGFREVIYDPEADPGLVRQQLERLNRTYFVDILNQREGTLPQQINDIADELEVIRREVLDQVQIAEEQERSQDLRNRVEDYLKSAPKETLTSEDVQPNFIGVLADSEVSYEVLGNRILQFDRNTLMQMLLAGRQDLSQDEAEQVLSQLESARDMFLNRSREEWEQVQAEAIGLQQRVEEYLRHTNLEDLQPEGIQRELRALLDDPQAGALALRERLSQFDRDTLVQWLSQRQDLNEEQINRVIDQVESVRDTVLQVPQQVASQAQEQYDQVMSQIADYLRNTNLDELNPEGIRHDLTTLLNQPRTGALALRDRLSQVDRDTLVALLNQRDDLNEDQINQLIDQVQETIGNVVRAPRQLAKRTAKQVRDFPTNLSEYLRNTHKDELNPEGIRRDLQRLLKQPGAGLEQLGDRFSQFDRSTLVALLSERDDISEDEANRIVDQVESVGNQLIEQGQKLQRRLQSVVDGVFAQVREYLNSLDREELNYEGIKRDLRKLFDDPEAGFDALGDRLSQFDRDTLVALLSSRSDMSEAQADRIIDQVEAARDSVLGRAKWLQAEAEKRIKELQGKAKEQAREAQKTVATAAWWLFGAALTSVATAAIAGVLAAGGLTVFS
ncbi:MFS transporter [Oculatella sp. LEGE 06141]|uniref:MFS transporter n=1 Tax=Oculatella sp. LEGE 06141 TaxID=1828648 RepID=UPI00187FE59E|nr:MFS transporter [Oculatella sp. LEGE 06141]MBE9181411.1 MFS transporter [Oculatella sp. LEGE 06141]